MIMSSPTQCMWGCMASDQESDNFFDVKPTLWEESDFSKPPPISSPHIQSEDSFRKPVDIGPLIFVLHSVLSDPPLPEFPPSRAYKFHPPLLKSFLIQSPDQASRDLLSSSLDNPVLPSSQISRLCYSQVFSDSFKSQSSTLRAIISSPPLNQID